VNITAKFVETPLEACSKGSVFGYFTRIKLSKHCQPYDNHVNIHV
jgi:hypothetical protein